MSERPTPDGLDWDRIDAVLCDMDGTLLDLRFDQHFWVEAVPAAWGAHRGMALAEAQQELRPLFARHSGTLNWYCLDFWTRTLGLDVRALKRELAHGIGYLPGIEAVLARLARSGRARLLVTNAHPDVLAIKNERTGLLAHFDSAWSTHDFGAPKEDPEFWRRFAQRSGVKLERALLLDDSVPVLDGALGGGVGQVVGILRPSTEHPPRPASGRYHEVHSLAELDWGDLD